MPVETFGQEKHGSIIGTIECVAPEYMTSKEIDHLSDIYSLGVVAYELATGHSPFRGSSFFETMKMRLESTPTPPSALREDYYPEWLSDAILKAMSRSPEDRFASADEFQAVCEGQTLAAN